MTEADRHFKETCKRINKLESKADSVFDKAVADIFENETDVKNIIKYKEVSYRSVFLGVIKLEYFERIFKDRLFEYFSIKIKIIFFDKINIIFIHSFLSIGLYFMIPHIYKKVYCMKNWIQRVKIIIINIPEQWSISIKKDLTIGHNTFANLVKIIIPQKFKWFNQSIFNLHIMGLIIEVKYTEV